MSKITKQGNKEFFDMDRSGRTVYIVYRIDGRFTTGRQASYYYLKCEFCGRIIGTQFNAF